MKQVWFARIDEDFALVEEMLALLPAGVEGWRPAWPGDAPLTVEELAAHLAESFGGVCACFAKLLSLRKVETVGLSVGESGAVMAAYRAQVREAFELMEDADLVRVIPTYFVPEGEPFLAVLLTNWKHVNHHAHQLFIYLKLLGVPVGTRHLYRFR